MSSTPTDAATSPRAALDEQMVEEQIGPVWRYQTVSNICWDFRLETITIILTSHSVCIQHRIIYLFGGLYITIYIGSSLGGLWINQPTAKVSTCFFFIRFIPEVLNHYHVTMPSSFCECPVGILWIYLGPVGIFEVEHWTHSLGHLGSISYQFSDNGWWWWPKPFQSCSLQVLAASPRCASWLYPLASHQRFSDVHHCVLKSFFYNMS